MNRNLMIFLSMALLQGCAVLMGDSDEEKSPSQANTAIPSPGVEAKVETKIETKDEGIAPPLPSESTVSIPASVPTPVPAKPATREELAAERGFFHDSKTNRYFSNGKAAFSFRMSGVTKDLGAVSVSINDGEYIPYTGKLNFETEGLNHLKFSATDSLANSSPIQDFKIFVDKTPPIVKSFWQGPNAQESEALFVSGLSIFTINAQDAYSGVSKIIVEEDGAVKTYTGPIKFSDGKHNIKYYAVDNVGNQSDSIQVEFQVDSTAPVTKTVVKGSYYKSENETFVNANAQVNLEGEESTSGLSKIEYILNGGPITSYQEPFLMTDSKMEIKFRGTDRAGNIEPWKIIRLTSDSTPPVVKLETHGQYMQKGSHYYALPGFFINIKAKDDESNIGEIQVSNDGKTFEKANSNKILFDKTGEFHFSARISDHVENITDSNSYIVIIDNQAPESQVRANDRLILKDGVYYSAIPSQIEISADDKTGVGTEKIEYGFDGKSFQTYAGPIDASTWSTPKRTLYFRATDRLKNVEAVKSAQIEVQTEGPQVDLMVESADAPEVPLSALVEKKIEDKKETVKEETKIDLEKAPQAVDLMVEAPGLPQVPVQKFVDDQKKLEKEQEAIMKKLNKKKAKK